MKFLGFPPDSRCDPPARSGSEHGSSPDAAPARPAAELSNLAAITGADEHFGFGGSPRPPSTTLFDPGSVLGGVTILRLIAEGGMGRVYEGRQDVPARLVAVKVLRDDLGSPAVVRRFRQEADLLARLRHPHIAQVHAAGTEPGPAGHVSYLVMELVADATPLTGFARERRLPPRDRVSLFAKVAAALAHAHREGVVHRDLKPGNILVDAAGEPKVIDFGVARAIGAGDVRLTTATELGELLGTVRYMSPEQLGLDEGEADSRSDVYALGLVLHELLIDELPYELGGRSILEAACILTGRAGGDSWPLARRLRARGLAADEAASLAVIVTTCLEPRPSDRYQSARELAAELDRWLRGQPILARPQTFPQALGRLARRHRAAATAAAATCAVVVLALGGIAWAWQVAEVQRHAANAARAAADEARDLADQRRQEADDRTAETRRHLYLSTVLLAAEARDRDNLTEARRLLAEARHLTSEPATSLIELDLLAASLDDSLTCLTAADGSVTAGAWSPGGDSLACGTEAGQVRLWQSARPGSKHAVTDDTPWREAHAGSFTPHDRAVWGVVFSPTGDRLASASADGTVRVHDVATGSEIRRLVAHEGAVYGVAFSPDGSLLATSSRDTTVRLWNTRGWQEEKRLEGHTGTVLSVRFAADGHTLLSTAADGTARIWRVADATELLAVTAGTSRVFGAAFAPDHASFATAAEDGTARVWDLATGSLQSECVHPRRVNAVAFLGSRDKLATASGDGLLRCWDTKTRTEVASRRGHAAAIMALTPGPDGFCVATGSADGTVRTWDLGPAGEPVVPLGDGGLAVACTADGGTLAVGSADGVIRLVDAATLRERRRSTGITGRVNGLAFSADGDLVVAAADDGAIHRWQLSSGEVLPPLAIHRRRAYAVCFAPDGQSLATAGEDRTSRIIDPLTGIDRTPPLRHPARVFCAAYHPNGRSLATACEDRIVRLWDTESGRELAAWPGHTGPVNWVCFSPDGGRLASASSDGTVRSWNVATGSLAAVYSGPARQVWKVAFSRDGSRIAAASADSTVQLWDAVSGRPVSVLRGHRDGVWGLAFLPDRNVLATASQDGTLRLWGVPMAMVAHARAAATADWDQFRGPTADGRAPAATLPLEWSETENVRWKTPIPGKAWASPVAADGRIWLANATEDGTRLSAVCVDADTGRVLHDVTVFEIAEPAFCHPYNSPASPTPVLANGKLFVHFGSAGTACLDAATGEILWSRQDLPCDHHRGPGSSPIPWQDRLFINFDGFDHQYVVALDQATGKTLWKTDRTIDYRSDDGDMKKAYGTPAVIEQAGRTLLVSPAAVATVAYDPATGRDVWQVYHGGYNASARPLLAGGLVIVTTAGGDNVVAIRPDGTGDVTQTHVVWKFKKSAPTRPSQAAVKDHLYLVSDTGVFSCVELATGKIAWQERRTGRHSASPVESGGRLWWCDEDGTTVVTAANPERFELLAENTLEAGCMASPAVIGNDLVIRTKTHLYRIGQPQREP